MDEKLAKAADAWLCAERNRVASAAHGGLPGLDRLAAHWDEVGFGWLLMALDTKRADTEASGQALGECPAALIHQGGDTRPGESEEL